MRLLPGTDPHGLVLPILDRTREYDTFARQEELDVGIQAQMIVGGGKTNVDNRKYLEIWNVERMR